MSDTESNAKGWQLEGVAEALRNSQLFLDSIVEHLPHMIFVKDARELRFVRLNRAGEELLGFSRNELIGKNDYDFFPKSEADSFTAKDREVLDGKQRVDIPDEPIHTKEHGLRILHTQKIPILDESDRPMFLLGISEDITDRKKIEDDLRLQSEIVRHMAEAVVLIRTTEGTIVHVNPSCESMFGYSADELIGEGIVRLGADGQLDPTRTDGEIARALEESGTWLGEIQNERKDGTSFWTAAKVSRLEHTNHGPAWLCVLEDITERKAAQERLVEAERLASIGTLAAGLAHEINNPVGAILLHAQSSLECGPDREDLREESLRAIVEQAKRCGRVVRNVLQLAKHEATERWPSDLNVIVHRAKYVSHMRALEREVRIDLALSEDLPMLRINPTEIEQVVVNLLQNAIQARERGVHIEVRTENTGDSIRLTVADDGPGVSEADRKYIFDPFYTGRQHHGGSGLGLSLVYTILESHEGTIRVECPDSGGTCVVVDLPLTEND